MIHLYSKIQDAFINELLYEIDSNIIVESLNCKILRDVAKQLKQMRDDEKDRKDNEKYGSSSVNNRAFKNIFATGSYMNRIEWDKISDEDVKEINITQATDKERRKAEQEAHKVLQTKSKAIIIIYDPKEDVYDYAFCNWGDVIKLSDRHGDSTGVRVGNRGPNGKWHDLKVSEKMDLLKNKILYYIDLTGKAEKYNELSRKRSEEKRGMVLMDEESLKQMAANNLKRYKEIVAKNKANRLNNTALLDEAGAMIEAISRIATEIAKKPIENADLIEPVNRLCAYVYDTRKYIPGRTYRDKGYYSGVNGLLPMIGKYTKLLKDVQTSGGYDYQRKELENSQNEIKASIEKIKEIASKANIDLGVKKTTEE